MGRDVLGSQFAAHSFIIPHLRGFFSACKIYMKSVTFIHMAGRSVTKSSCPLLCMCGKNAYRTFISRSRNKSRSEGRCLIRIRAAKMRFNYRLYEPFISQNFLFTALRWKEKGKFWVWGKKGRLFFIVVDSSIKTIDGFFLEVARKNFP